MKPQLSRLLLIFGLLVAAFIFTRWIAQPRSFYAFGHYRGDALTEIGAHPVHYAAPDACADCHDEEVAQKAAGPHRNISCQSCHGPGNGHVAEPSMENILHPDIHTYCAHCHAASVARPANFPQIAVKDHADNKSCDSCHLIHNPGEIRMDEAQ